MTEDVSQPLTEDVPTESPQTTSVLGVAIRDLERLRDVVRTVVRCGFGEGLPSALRGLILSKDKVDEEMLSKPEPVRFRLMLEELGPTYVKFGQILSMRSDILPVEYASELEQLQDQASSMSFNQVRLLIETHLDRSFNELFEEFEVDPLGTASIAQTHRAITRGGDEIVVKVQRPGLRKMLYCDLDLLHLAARLLESTVKEATLYQFTRIVSEFEDAMLKELDFTIEMNNLRELRDNLDPSRDVVVPRPLPSLSCERVLCMEYFKGRSIRELPADTPEAHRVAEELLHVFMKQTLLDGVFHGDPHPGNILINDDGTTCLIDAGMVGRLTQSQREELVSLILATITRDVDALARTLIHIGRPRHRIDMAEFKADIERIQSQQLGKGSYDDYDASAFSQEFLEAAKHHGIQLAPEYTILVRSSTAIEGLLRRLSPKIDLHSIARPYAEQVLFQQLKPHRFFEQTMTSLLGVGSVYRQLPEQLDQVMHDVKTGHLQIETRSLDMRDLIPTIRQLGGQLLLTAFAVTMSLTGTFLLPNDPLVLLGVPLLSVLALLFAIAAWTTLALWYLLGSGQKFELSSWKWWLNRA
ncbi:MAG: hypothetical protein CMH57_06015 [Myxococcales bacterium]|nr:hypothetical protein [Myxococcales bacterium]